MSSGSQNPKVLSGWRDASWTLLTVALFPLLLAETIWAIRRTPQLPEPPGPRRGTSGAPDRPRLRVMILGDSSAAGVGVDHQDQALLGQLVGLLSQEKHVHWELVAKTGATTASTCTRLAAQQDHPVDLVITGLGVNDVTHMIPTRQVLADTTKLLDMIDRKLGGPLVILSGLPPVDKFPALPQPLRMIVGYRARRLDALLRRHVAHRANVLSMPFDLPLTASHMSRDGFHPGPVVYHHWAKTTFALLHKNAPIDRVHPNA